MCVAFSVGGVDRAFEAIEQAEDGRIGERQHLRHQHAGNAFAPDRASNTN